MADIVPLAEWYPSMYDLWVREGRRLSVPIGDRKGYTVHHTFGGVGQAPQSYARWVAHYHYHTKGWRRPGGYSFQIGTDGVIREMCGWGFVGAHAPGCNYNSIGVSFQGSFNTTLPNDKQFAAFSDLVATGPVPNRQQGHRDCTAGRTCPGAALYAALPLDVTQPGLPEEAVMARSMLTRIDGSTAVYQIVGQFLIALTKPEQAGLIVQHAGLEEGRAVDIVNSGAWRDHIGDMTPNEAGHFTVVNRLSDLGGGLSESEADARYASKGHTHTGTVKLR